MANHKSAEKRVRNSRRKQTHNKAKKSRVRSAIKDLRQAIASSDKSKAQQLLVTVQSLMAKLAKSPAMKKGTAAQKTSRLATQVGRL